MSEPEGCKRCGHLIGYHWDGDGEMWCTASQCDCKGYVDPDESKVLSRLPKAADDKRETSQGNVTLNLFQGPFLQIERWAVPRDGC